MLKNTFSIICYAFVFFSCARYDLNSKNQITENFPPASIIGGIELKKSDPDSKNAVLLFLDGQLCSSTVIADSVLLTAAHCVADADVANSRAIFANSWDSSREFNPKIDGAKIKYFLVHPQFNPRLGEENILSDIALVFLNEKVPADYPVFKIADPTSLPKNGSLYLYGYGFTKYNSNDGKILRKTEIKRNKFKVINNTHKVIIDQTNEIGVCMGDSGGPAFVNIQNTLQILSLSSYNTYELSQLRCSSLAYETLISPFIPWIKHAIHQNLN